MKRNILLAYCLAYLKSSWFWLGVWVYYYLRYTNYAGIGLIETTMILTMTLTEVPTGALSDLIGKKRTLAIAFFLKAAGELIMANAPNIGTLLFSIVVMSLGWTLISGTFEALIFDSLKESGKEHTFDKVIANISTIQLVAIAVSGLASGFLYTVNPSLPYYAVGLACTIGFVLTFFLVEPKVDTEKFSLHNFLEYNKRGLTQLARIIKTSWIAPVIVGVSALWVISDEMMESILAFEFGFSPKTVGIFFAFLFLLVAGAAQCAPFIRKRLGTESSVILLTCLIVLTYLVSPFAGIVLGGLSLVLRNVFAQNFLNISSVFLNNSIDSKYRATTLSTYNMLKNVPYVVTAFAIGSLMDKISAKRFSFNLGLIMIAAMVCYGVVVLVRRRLRETNNSILNNTVQ